MCGGCRDCGGTPPAEPKPEGDDAPDELDEADELVADIEDMAAWADAGSPPDFTCYPFEIAALFKIWRQAEAEVANLRANRLTAFIKGFYKEK